MLPHRDLDQLALGIVLDDAEEVAAYHLSPEEVQTISRNAQIAFEQKRDNAWFDDYLFLRDCGWNWRVAAFIAWSATPRDERLPRTLALLATEVLGLHSDRTIRKWRERNPAIDEAIAQMKIAPIFDNLRGVMQALVSVASQHDSKGAADRRTLLTMAGLYANKTDVTLTGKTKSLSELSEAELAELEARLKTTNDE